MFGVCESTPESRGRKLAKVFSKSVAGTLYNRDGALTLNQPWPAAAGTNRAKTGGAAHTSKKTGRRRPCPVNHTHGSAYSFSPPRSRPSARPRKRSCSKPRRVIAGDGSAAIEGAAFLVENGTITRVGRKNEIALPAGATRIDLGDKTVMPALISTHVHPGFQMGLGYFAKNFTRENILDDLNRALYFGVSTVMSQGVERGDVMFDIRADQAAGRAGGARLLLAGRGMGAPNAGPGNPVYAGFAYSVTTEDEIRRAVQEQAARKVDAIKIWVDDRGGRAPKLPIALSRAAIEEGHKHGLKVSAHIFYHDDAMELAAAGIDSFAHLVRDREMSDAAGRAGEEEQRLRHAEHRVARNATLIHRRRRGSTSRIWRACCATPWRRR